MAKIVNGTTYKDETPDEVIRVLENARIRGTRIRIHYGYTQHHHRRALDQKPMPEGRDWHEENDVQGTIGRSTGTVKIPLMIANRRSSGGSGILDNCIVRIRTTGKNGKDLYRHPNYATGEVKIVAKAVTVPGKTYTHAVTIDDEEHAAFDSEEHARKWIAKMGLTVN